VEPRVAVACEHLLDADRNFHVVTGWVIGIVGAMLGTTLSSDGESWPSAGRVLWASASPRPDPWPNDRGLLVAFEQQRRIGAAKAERIRQRVLDRQLSRGLRDVIEVALGVRHV